MGKAELIVTNEIQQLHQKIWDQKQPTKMDVVNIVILIGKVNARIDELEHQIDLDRSLDDPKPNQHRE